MRSRQSNILSIAAFKARPRCMTTFTACIEALEGRTLLSTIKIPVLTYHRDEVLDNDPTHGFAAQMFELNQRSMHSISLEQYHAWRVNGTALPSRPFIAIFDDATDDAIDVAAPLMQTYGFKGVTAIPTQDNPATPDWDGNPATPSWFIGNTAHNYMTWSELQTLTGTGQNQFGWSVASHTVDHMYLGNGPGFDPNNLGSGPTYKYRNTPSEIATQMTASKTKIQQQLGITPLGFVHPNDDVTRRSLAVAAASYPLVFGGSFRAADDANRKYIGDTSGLTNGQLYRIGIVEDEITIADFEDVLDDAIDGSQFTTSIYQYTNKYLARDGTGVFDGTINSSGVDVNDSFTFPGSWTFGPTYTDQTVTATRLDAHGYGGNDTLTGGSGNDTIYGEDGADTMVGNPGHDYLHGGIGNDTITGNDGNDTLHGSSGQDTLNGGNQTDFLNGGSSGDFLTGGSGTDTLDYTDKTLGVTVDMNAATDADDGTAGEGDDVKDTFEVLWGSEFNDVISASAVSFGVTIMGGNGADSLTGGSGNDSLDGGASVSSDTLRGGFGDDILNAGVGTDSMFGDDGNDSFWVHDGYKDTVTGGNGTDVLLDLADGPPNQDTINL